MSTQLFVSMFPIHDFVDLLQSCCDFTDDFCILNTASYKKLCFLNTLQPFLHVLTNHYHVSKQSYATRPMNYVRFLTIIRQLCKHLIITYTPVKKNIRSTYEISYVIYIMPNENNS